MASESAANADALGAMVGGVEDCDGVCGVFGVDGFATCPVVPYVERVEAFDSCFVAFGELAVAVDEIEGVVVVAHLVDTAGSSRRGVAVRGDLGRSRGQVLFGDLMVMGGVGESFFRWSTSDDSMLAEVLGRRRQFLFR